jgi:hypothetical protein
MNVAFDKFEPACFKCARISFAHESEHVRAVIDPAAVKSRASSASANDSECCVASR